MPNRAKLYYRINKLYKFRKDFDWTIKNNIEEEIDEETPDLVIIDEPEDIIRDHPQQEIINDLVGELDSIRKNAKRKLELWIKKNRTLINSLDLDVRGELMNYIEHRYYT